MHGSELSLGFPSSSTYTKRCLSQLLKRIVAPDFSPEDIEQEKRGVLASRLHDYTHGINSDPLALLAIIVSALIHDADHRGGK